MISVTIEIDDKDGLPYSCTFRKETKGFTTLPEALSSVESALAGVGYGGICLLEAHMKDGKSVTSED
jgi:hypothetical protein